MLPHSSHYTLLRSRSTAESLRRHLFNFEQTPTVTIERLSSSSCPRTEIFMLSPTPKRVLVVDDYSAIRATQARILRSAGYEVSTAEDGFSALLLLQGNLPDLIISGLNMPNMSGFEFLSVVRRRFPQLPVVAISGAYESGDAVPGGVIADAFYSKNSGTPVALLKMIEGLFHRSGAQTMAQHRNQAAPVWIPRNGKDAQGTPYVVLTCTECLRSFPISVMAESAASVLKTPCVFCLNQVRYIIDFSLPAPQKKHAEGSNGIPRRTGAPKGIAAEKIA